ncbi:hypothetical protein [Paraburkholderia terrae]|uniref:hypothetical protein n=1 Tax=Paraburkholderia terrae TaxID=311230 RepID=UPI001E4783FB|nr:hypothetical protein [Paraburkholderia terrae]
MKNTDPEVKAFREHVSAFIRSQLLPTYVDGYRKSTHSANLGHLVDYGTSAGVSTLGPKGFKVDVAQKLLNTVLKYYWVPGSYR